MDDIYECDGAPNELCDCLGVITKHCSCPDSAIRFCKCPTPDPLFAPDEMEKLLEMWRAV